MSVDEHNRYDATPEEIGPVIDRAKDLVQYSAGRVWIKRLLMHQKSVDFMRDYDLDRNDIVFSVMGLRLEEYSHISCKEGYPDAYVFGVRIPRCEYREDVYFKFSFTTNALSIEALSYHEPEKPLKYPFRKKES